MNGAAVKAYSLKKDGSKNITANFKVREFACKDGSDTVFVSENLAQVLQQIRYHFGRPVTITSGYRTEPHNRKEGGAEFSQHLYGLAADIMVSGVASDKVYDYADKLLGATGGVGRYNGYTHVDVRKTKSRF